MIGSGISEVITSKGCLKMYSDINCTNSSTDLQPPPHSTSNSPFSGLIICVIGLSKEARKQVMDATERLGGQFSSHLHPKCTHLVVQSSHECKSEYASKGRAKDGLFIVTLGWFVDSVRKNERLKESLYMIKSFGENYTSKGDLNKNSCLHVAILDNVKQHNSIQRSRLHSLEDQKRRRGSIFSGQTVYVDPDVTTELRNKVVEAAREEGGLIVNEWLVGQCATHVICEGSSVGKYLGQSSNLVTPLWVLKTVKEARSERLVHLSADLAHHVGMKIRNVPRGKDQKDHYMIDDSRDIIKLGHKANQSIANLAKIGVRNRRTKVIKPLTPSILLNSIKWIMSEPSSTAYICSDSFTGDADGSMEEPDACFVNFLQPLSEREMSKLIFDNHFITIMFPVDRFGEMGLCSRTFFSNTRFTCSQLLDHIYTFYQENMSISEIELAIHTDSRHADRLRSMYSTKEVVEVKRIAYLGSRRSFQMLKRLPGDHNKNVYELLTKL